MTGWPSWQKFYVELWKHFSADFCPPVDFMHRYTKKRGKSMKKIQRREKLWWGHCGHWRMGRSGTLPTFFRPSVSCPPLHIRHGCDILSEPAPFLKSCQNSVWFPREHSAWRCPPAAPVSVPEYGTDMRRKKLGGFRTAWWKRVLSDLRTAWRNSCCPSPLWHEYGEKTTLWKKYFFSVDRLFYEWYKTIFLWKLLFVRMLAKIG